MITTLDIITEEITLDISDDCTRVDLVEVESFVLEFDGVLKGDKGDQGDPGPPGGSIVTWPAGQNLSSGRAVIIDDGKAFYFQPGNVLHHGRAYGITATSALITTNVDIQIGGERSDAAFSFVADTPVWVDEDGEIVNTQPSGLAIVQQAGVASAAKKMIINFSLSIKNN